MSSVLLFLLFPLLGLPEKQKCSWTIYTCTFVHLNPNCFIALCGSLSLVSSVRGKLMPHNSGLLIVACLSDSSFRTCVCGGIVTFPHNRFHKTDNCPHSEQQLWPVMLLTKIRCRSQNTIIGSTKTKLKNGLVVCEENCKLCHCQSWMLRTNADYKWEQNAATVREFTVNLFLFVCFKWSHSIAERRRLILFLAWDWISFQKTRQGVSKTLSSFTRPTSETPHVFSKNTCHGTTCLVRQKNSLFLNCSENEFIGTENVCLHYSLKFERSVASRYSEMHEASFFDKRKKDTLLCMLYNFHKCVSLSSKENIQEDRREVWKHGEERHVGNGSWRSIGNGVYFIQKPPTSSLCERVTLAFSCCLSQYCWGAEYTQAVIWFAICVIDARDK